jgi:hypothetical protein
LAFSAMQHGEALSAAIARLRREAVAHADRDLAAALIRQADAIDAWTARNPHWRPARRRSRS